MVGASSQSSQSKRDLPPVPSPVTGEVEARLIALSRGLVAIDPKACVGDPCFDAVDYVVAGAGHEGAEARCRRVATACGLDGDRLYAWSRVIAPMFAIAYLTYDGPEPAIDELLAMAR